MDQQAMREIMTGRRRGAAASAARLALHLAAGPYAAAMSLRRWGYRRGLLASRSGPLPAICVGNITVGGTGKTPMVAYVAGVLTRAGLRPAILTRGYKASGGRSDEAELLKALTGLPVIVNADRLAGSQQAAERGCDVCVLDDGFQHRRLRRDLDIVLIDASDPFGGGHCLPRGLLREPPRALADAGAVVITRSDEADAEQLAALRGRLASLAPAASIHLAAHVPQAFISPEGSQAPTGALAGRRVLAFCGLGNPEAFYRLLRRLGVDLADTISLGDHAEYTADALRQIDDRLRTCGAEAAITTQKDAVKLPPAPLAAPLWQLAVRMEVVEGQTELQAKILSAARAGGGTIAR